MTRYLGNFVVRSKKYPLAPPRDFDDPDNPDVAYLANGGPPTAAIIRYMEEKGSDVNLAVRLLDDAFRAKFKVAVVISNDQDLVEPIRIVSKDILLPVGVVNPRPKYFAQKLADVADFKRNIDKRLLRKSLFPDELTDSLGTFRKPPTW